MRTRVSDLSRVEKIVIHTSYHTHHVIGTGANDPQKLDPLSSRETLDHSLMYIFAVAVEDGHWHHIRSYSNERASRPETVRLWHKIETREDPEWTRRYHSTDPGERAFGGRVEIFMRDGKRIEEEIRVANAHPLGAAPLDRAGYQRKFQTLSEGILSLEESSRFLETMEDLSGIQAGQLGRLNVADSLETLAEGIGGIF